MKKDNTSESRPFEPTAKNLIKLLRKTKTLQFGTCMGEVRRYSVEGTGEVVVSLSITLELLMTNQGTSGQPVWNSVPNTEGFSLPNLKLSDFSVWTIYSSDGTVTANLTTGHGKHKKVVTYVFINEHHRLKKPTKAKKG